MDGERMDIQSETVLTVSITPLVLSLVTLAETKREYVKEIHWAEFFPDVVVKLLELVRLHPGAALESEEWQARARPKGDLNPHGFLHHPLKPLEPCSTQISLCLSDSYNCDGATHSVIFGDLPRASQEIPKMVSGGTV